MHRLTRSASLTDYEAVARSVGLDPFLMLRTAKLPAAILNDPNLMIGIGSVGWLLEESARLSGQEAFGLLLAERRSLANLGMLALLIREEPTLGAAMQSCVRYMRLHNAGVQLRLEDAGEAVLLHVSMTGQPPGAWRQAIEMSAGIALRTLHVLSGGGFSPESISFTHERPKNLDVHRRVLGPTLHFSQECNAIICRPRDLDQPITAADPALNREVRRWLDIQLTNLREEPAQQVREIITMLLPSGLCSVERVAQHLGMHRRTFSRHMAAEGETYEAILDAVRVDLAHEYLANRKRKLHEVADLLGFSGSSAFSRWFRSQFGMAASKWAGRQREGRSGEASLSGSPASRSAN